MTRMRRVRRFFAGFFITLLAFAVSGTLYQTFADWRDLVNTPPPGRMVDIGGHRLHLWCKGIGTPTVVMDNGLGGTSFGWNFVIDGVAMFTQACAYDRAGQGYSDEGPNPQTSLQIAQDLHVLLNRANKREPLVLVGASFGGFTVRLFATESSRHTVGVVLVDASHENQGGGMPPFADLVPIAGTLGGLRMLGITLGPDPDAEPPDVREYQRATSYRASRFRSMYSEARRLSESAAQVRERRRELAVPLLVLTAGRNRDPRWLALQQDQATLSTRGCQTVVEGAGHIIARDNPAAVIEGIRATIEASRWPDGTPCDVTRTHP